MKHVRGVGCHLEKSRYSQTLTLRPHIPRPDYRPEMKSRCPVRFPSIGAGPRSRLERSTRIPFSTHNVLATNAVARSVRPLGSIENRFELIAFRIKNMPVALTRNPIELLTQDPFKWAGIVEMQIRRGRHAIDRIPKRVAILGFHIPLRDLGVFPAERGPKKLGLDPVTRTTAFRHVKPKRGFLNSLGPRLLHRLVHHRVVPAQESGPKILRWQQLLDGSTFRQRGQNRGHRIQAHRLRHMMVDIYDFSASLRHLTKQDPKLPGIRES